MASTEPIQEATGRDLLHVPMAWAMARRIGRRQRFSTARLPLLDHSLRIDNFAFFVAYDFQVDRLSDWVVKRSTFDNTYAKTIRPKTDHELPSETLESVQHNQMPQFTLRNIGRFEMSVDLDERLPFYKVKGLGGQLGAELDEVRKAHVPRPKMAQIWSVDLVRRVGASMRRLFVEEPWELRFGSEVTSAHSGLRHSFAVEGTHPDDMPGQTWGPDVVPSPAVWQEAPFGEPRMERPRTMADELARLADMK